MDRRIEIVITKIETDPSSQLPQLAELVNLSVSRLRHLFRQETGTAISQYQRQIRLTKAEVLLRTSFFSIKEIIGQLALPANSHFVREFKKVYGMSPAAYRSLHGLSTRKAHKRRSKEG